MMPQHRNYPYGSPPSKVFKPAVPSWALLLAPEPSPPSAAALRGTTTTIIDIMNTIMTLGCHSQHCH